MSIRIKNWERFQHFKDRKPLWLKLYRDLLDDIEWHELDPLDAKTLVSLWLLASENDGELPPIKTIAFRLRITESSVKSTITKLSHWLIQDDIEVISSGYQDDMPRALAERREEKEKEARTKRAHQLPDDFTLNESSLAYCAKRGLNGSEFESFKNWHSAKGSTYRDWQAAWRTWCDKAVSFGRGKEPESDKPFDMKDFLRSKGAVP